MNHAISDLALDLGNWRLDEEYEKLLPAVQQTSSPVRPSKKSRRSPDVPRRVSGKDNPSNTRETPRV
jgi:hypothetical protein